MNPRNRQGCLWPLCIAIAASIFFGGCIDRGPTVSEPIEPVSRVSIQHFGDAHSAFVRAMTTTVEPGERAQAMDRCLNHLRDAVSASSVDPRQPGAYACPLFRTRLADMLLDIGDATDRPFELYWDSVDETGGAVEWIPGWIGLAAWATSKISSNADKAHEASRYLDEAERNLERLLKATRKPLAANRIRPFGGILRLAELAAAPPSVPENAGRSDDERLRLLWNWLLANEQWWEPMWQKPSSTDLPPAGETTGELERRLRARIAYQRAMISLASGAPPAVVRGELRNSEKRGALDWDPNFWPGQIEMARLLRLNALFDAAEGQLVYYVETPGVLLAGNPHINLELGRIYADWYARDHEWRLAQLAEQRLRAVIQRYDPRSTHAWLEFGRVSALVAIHEVAMLDSQRLGAIQNAQDCLEEAARLQATEAELATLRAHIARARQAIQGAIDAQ